LKVKSTAVANFYLVIKLIIEDMTNSTPPPPNRQKSTSPWVWVGLGCGTAMLITVGGIVTIGLLTQRAFKEFSKPVTSQEAVAKLGNVPIYQPSTFDEIRTKSMRLSTSLFSGKTVSTAAFDTSDPPNQVMTWYEQQLANKGYRASTRQSILKNLTQVTFQKQTDLILVQTQDSSTSSRKDYWFVLMRLQRPARDK
jgi:hypothetical protein